ncbi:hypothetical protein [Clostridium felsineum]|uniref:hypothetical protein n=1 Tax=Clostridium felsineum TaxID=36839 RepID=UPI00098C9B26|nr:hypothetical protein [Clostridium felsineum]URZ03182.1 hypothetical protein CLAUR_032280 [Clostridium felsineum]
MNNKGSIGSRTSIIINTRIKKYRTMIKCNCHKCVNLSKNGCRFGWEPIKGKCSRYGTNQYKLSKEEAKEAKERTIANREVIEKEKELAKQIRTTSVSKLSKALDTNIKMKLIMESSRNKYFGNGRFSIKCIDKERNLIRITFQDRSRRIYRVIDK